MMAADSAATGGGKPEAAPERDADSAIEALEAAYGSPSQAAFGSAVFHKTLPADADLQQAALTDYQAFVGDLWQRFGAEAWLGAWRQVYERPRTASPDIVSELRSIGDRDAAGAVHLILDEIDNAEAARAALAAVYDDPAVRELRVLGIGDGAAMAGILVAGRRADNVAISLVFLMD